MQYPNANIREDLARRIELSEATIQIWFSNRRSKSRKNQSHHSAMFGSTALHTTGFNANNLNAGNFNTASFNSTSFNAASFGRPSGATVLNGWPNGSTVTASRPHHQTITRPSSTLNTARPANYNYDVSNVKKFAINDNNYLPYSNEDLSSKYANQTNRMENRVENRLENRVQPDTTTTATSTLAQLHLNGKHNHNLLLIKSVESI